ncbi:MAG: ATP synthase subunit I [Xanthomonadaceae bacterium]|nr:ATP synthase subunit I [Xanthomonadaceae bacterium]
MSTKSVAPKDNPAGLDESRFAQMAVWLLRTQAILVVVAALAGVVLTGASNGLAVLAGGAIGIALTAVSALRAGSVPASGNPGMMAAAFYRGMMLKMVFAVVLFGLVALWFAEWFLPVLAGYVVTLVAFWLALLRLGRNSPTGTASNDEQ